MSELKKYVFKVKLAKEGEEFKALSVVGNSMEMILSKTYREDYDSWEVVSIVRGSMIDIC